GEHRLIQGLSDMLPADGLVHTQIIDIQRPDIRQDVVVKVLLKDAERIPEHPFLFIHRHKDRPGIVMDQFPQLFVRVFFLSRPEQIRTALMMHHIYLDQQTVDIFHIALPCSSYLCHSSTLLFSYYGYLPIVAYFPMLLRRTKARRISSTDRSKNGNN